MEGSNAAEAPRKRKREGVLSSDYVCITGVSTSERETITGLVRAAGGLVCADLYSDVTVLIAGHSNTEKAHKAKTLGIPMVRVTWAHHSAVSTDRIDPESADYRLQTLSGFTVITSGFQGTDSERIDNLITSEGGLREVEVSKSTLPAKSAVLVREDGAMPRGEVLQRGVVKEAYAQCIPVVWEGWLAAVAAQGYVSETLLAKFSLIDSEPAVPAVVDASMETKLTEAMKRDPFPYDKAPLQGMSLYVHRGDAEAKCVEWVNACCVRLGASRSNTVSTRTTHLVVASPNSRRMLQTQRLAQIASGSLAPSGPIASVFPASHIVTLDWVFQCMAQGVRLDTTPFVYSLEAVEEKLPAKLAQRQPMVAPKGKSSASMPPLKKARESMGPPPVQPVKLQRDAGEVQEEKIKRAQKAFGASQMFKGCIFVTSTSFSRHGKGTVSQLVIAHGGVVLTQAKLEEGGNVGTIFFVDPHHPSRDNKLAHQVDKAPPDAQVVTEDWLTHCWNYLTALRGLAAEGSPEKFTATATRWEGTIRTAHLDHSAAVVAVQKTLSDLESGVDGALPDPKAHFMFHVAVLKRHALPDGRGVAASPFTQHGKLRTAKKKGTGVAVCFEGFTPNAMCLMAKAVELLGGKETRDFDSFVTTHVVVTEAYLMSEAGRASRLLKRAEQGAAKGGSAIVLGVEPAWLAQSATKGYFTEETPFVLFPQRAAQTPSQAVSEPTPVVKTKQKEEEKNEGKEEKKLIDPDTPSPRARLNFDTTLKRDTAVKVYFALSGKSGVQFPFEPLGVLTSIVTRLRGRVADTCSEATHLVTSTFITTETACVALASGKWILTPNWVRDSGRKGSWQQEGEYEWSPELVADMAARSEMSPQSRDVVKARVLAGAAQYWRRAKGGAFKQWNVVLLAEDAYLTTLKAGGANIVSRTLPEDFTEDRVILISKGYYKNLSPDYKQTIVNINMFRHKQLTAGADPQTVSECTNVFLYIDAISAHLQRNYLDLGKLACGYKQGLVVTQMPELPWKKCSDGK